MKLKIASICLFLLVSQTSVFALQQKMMNEFIEFCPMHISTLAKDNSVKAMPTIMQEMMMIYKLQTQQGFDIGITIIHKRRF